MINLSIFYHLSTDITKIGCFIPRIPFCRHQLQEDGQTERVCVSDSIEGCLSAIPNGGSRLEELLIKQFGLFKVFVIDTEKLGISDKKIIGYQELYETGKVNDAIETKEHWILQSFEVPEEDSFIISIPYRSYEERIYDDLPFEAMKLMEEEELFPEEAYEVYCEKYDVEFDDVVPLVSVLKM